MFSLFDVFLFYRFVQLRVCRFKANVTTDIKLSKIIFTPINVLDISTVYISVELGLLRIREEYILKELVERVMWEMFWYKREEMTGVVSSTDGRLGRM